MFDISLYNVTIEESKPTTNIFAGPLILLKLCDIVRRQQQLRLWRLLQDFQPGDGEEGVGKAQVKGSVARWQHLIPSFPWIAPGWRCCGRNPRKERDQILQRSRSLPSPKSQTHIILKSGHGHLATLFTITCHSHSLISQNLM